MKCRYRIRVDAKQNIPYWENGAFFCLCFVKYLGKDCIDCKPCSAKKEKIMSRPSETIIPSVFKPKEAKTTRNNK